MISSSSSESTSMAVIYDERVVIGVRVLFVSLVSAESFCFVHFLFGVFRVSKSLTPNSVKFVWDFSRLNVLSLVNTHRHKYETTFPILFLLCF